WQRLSDLNTLRRYLTSIGEYFDSLLNCRSEFIAVERIDVIGRGKIFTIFPLHQIEHDGAAVFSTYPNEFIVVFGAAGSHRIGKEGCLLLSEGHAFNLYITISLSGGIFQQEINAGV